jgi:hypothetical protein
MGSTAETTSDASSGDVNAAEESDEDWTGLLELEVEVAVPATTSKHSLRISK